MKNKKKREDGKNERNCTEIKYNYETRWNDLNLDTSSSYASTFKVSRPISQFHWE
jgi:hypothetical protein